MKKNLLFEIGVEDLPAKNLNIFSEKIKKNIEDSFLNNKINFRSIDNFFTNIRLTFTVNDIEENIKIPKQEIKGPPYDKCFDNEGTPTKTVLGFAKKHKVSIDLLSKKEFENKNYIFYEQPEEIIKVKDRLPHILEEALKNVEHQKRMRWGGSKISFIRPIRWLLLFYGDENLSCKICGIQTRNNTFGNKCISNNEITINNIDEYFINIEKNGVELHQSKRKELINREIKNIIKQNKFDDNIDSSLIDELTNMTEYPHIYLGKFPEKYLDLPDEVLRYVIQDTQKYFLVYRDNKIANFFIGVSNVKVNSIIIKGNERVINPRLDDANFFITKDLASNIFEKKDFLKRVIFHKKLGSMFDKVQRIVEISSYINSQSYRDNKILFKEIAEVCKLDLISNMVVEIPKLQGYIGAYYAKETGLTTVVANGIKDHYSPKNPEDGIPGTVDAQIVSMADKIDTIVGIFLINEKPSGTRDPLAIRRLSYGLIRILLNTKHSLSLTKLVDETQKLISNKLTDLKKNHKAVSDCNEFLTEKLISTFKEDYGLPIDVISSVVGHDKDINPFDMLKKIEAVNLVYLDKSYQGLFTNAKRVSNILKKSNQDFSSIINENLLRESSEKILYNSVKDIDESLKQLLDNRSYEDYLKKLNGLNFYIESFFDEVMINDKEEQIKLNRLSLLALINKNYTKFANIAILSH